MHPLITPTHVTFALGVIGILFAVYRYFKDPQTTEEKNAALLAQQVKNDHETYDRRFKDMQDSFQALLLQSNNHIHTVDTKVDKLQESSVNMGLEIARLTTIIDERIPKKI